MWNIKSSNFRQDCGDKIEAFLDRTHYINGGYDNKHGMALLKDKMEQIEVASNKFL